MSNTQIDARGLRCPLPVLKLEKAIEHLALGAQLIVLADDPIAVIDIPLFCQKSGHACQVERQDTHSKFVITKAGSPK